jgi:hypothetical protein
MEKHDEIKELLVPFVFDAVSERQVSELTSHIDVCEECRDEVKRLERLSECTKQMGTLSGDDDMLQSAKTAIIAAAEDVKKAGAGPTTNIQNVRRIIMTSRITKVGAAAVILMAVGLAIHFSGGSVDLTTIALGDIIEAMQKQPWMHSIYLVSQGGTTQNIETWINFEAKVGGFKMEPGKTQFWNFMDEEKYEFDPETNTITVEYHEDKLLTQLSSPAAAFEAMYETLRDLGAEITTQSGEYDGQEVQIQEAIYSREGQTVTLYVEPQSKLLLATEIEVTDPNGQVMASVEITYSYPQSGPSSIYDLGVPRDAEVINKLPSEDYSSIRKKYRQSRKSATKEYIAIVACAERFPSDAITRIDVDYKSGQIHRVDNHWVSRPGGEPQYKEQLGNTFDSLFAWVVNNYEQEVGKLSIYACDGRYTRRADRRKSGDWGVQTKGLAGRPVLLPIGSLGMLGWPQIEANGTIIEDDYSKVNNLICIERLRQGLINPVGAVSLPEKRIFYIDPQKDYICVRKVVEQRPDAEWQKDKNWLDGVKPEKISDGMIGVEDITELNRAPNGHWYPKVIVVKQADFKDHGDLSWKVESTKTIYVDTNPQFPEYVFNLESLPGE